jgi:hypothetical protein
MKKNNQRRPKPKAPRSLASGTAARCAPETDMRQAVCEPPRGWDEDEERKVGIISGTPADTFDETAERKHNKVVAIYISVLAVLIAIAATGSNDAMKTAQQAGFQVNDQFAFYQARLIRQSQLRLASDQLQLNLEENTSISEAVRTKVQEKKDFYDKEASRMESNRRNAKKELLARAESCENQRNMALAQHPFYDYSLAMLQIAIVLASASIITGTRLLLISSGAVGIFGILFFLNGYALIRGAPPQKYDKLEALQKALPWVHRFQAPIIARCPLD